MHWHGNHTPAGEKKFGRCRWLATIEGIFFFQGREHGWSKGKKIFSPSKKIFLLGSSTWHGGRWIVRRDGQGSRVVGKVQRAKRKKDISKSDEIFQKVTAEGKKKM